jgi:SpoVK/Ycf46/Vps4 family AAA+-type ATPase
LSKFLCTKPKTFDFSAALDAPDTEFIRWLHGNSNNNRRRDSNAPASLNMSSISMANKGGTNVKLYILEDIDRMFDKEQKVNVSLAALLNGLDGANKIKNSIIVATANRPELLDKTVLLRPGRFDRRIKFDCPSEENAYKFLKNKFKGERVSGNMIKDVVGRLKGHSFSLLNEIYISSIVSTFDLNRKRATDSDLKKAVQEHTYFLNEIKNVKKEKTGFGI